MSKNSVIVILSQIFSGFLLDFAGRSRQKRGTSFSGHRTEIAILLEIDKLEDTCSIVQYQNLVPSATKNHG